MAANDKTLKTAKGGLLAPQHYSQEIDDYEVTQGTKGASHVYVRNFPQDVTLQDAASNDNNGAPFSPTNGNCVLTFEITGTSTSRTVFFELAGPSGKYMPVTAFSVTDATKFDSQCTGGSNSAPESWQVEVPAGYSFRTRIGAVKGGNVTIKGKAVT